MEATVIELGPEASQLEVLIDQSEPAPPSQADESRWQTLAKANPRLFNGRILAFLKADLQTAQLHVRTDQYKRMAVQQNGTPNRLTQFGVTGLTIAPDNDGCQHILLGHRSNQTQVHPGRWELAPSGGVDAPEPSITRLSISDLSAQLLRELEEETGVNNTPTPPGPLALCHDPEAPSMDVIFQINLETVTDTHRKTWEYDDLVWVPVDRLDEQLHARNIDLIPPSAAVLRWFKRT